MTLSIIKMVLVQNRCQKWKERDKISKNANFEATVAEMPTYGDLKSGDFFPVGLPTPPPSINLPTPPPLLSPPLNAPTHPPAAPSEYKNILPPL